MLLFSAVTITAVSATYNEVIFTREEFKEAVVNIGIDPSKPMHDFTDAEIESIVPFVIKLYTDITGNEWYIKDLALLSAKGLIFGYPDGEFKGNADISRAEVITIFDRCIYNGNRDDYTQQEIVDKLKTLSTNNALLDMADNKESRIYGLLGTWFTRHVLNIKSIPFGRYTLSDMEKPMRRGEIMTLMSEEYLKREIEDENTQKALFELRFYTDSPDKESVLTSAEATAEALRKKYLDETGLEVDYYYPDFEDIVEGNERLMESSLYGLNLMTHQGVVSGYPDGSVGWKETVTRAEVVAMVARTFRKEQRVAEEDRRKDLDGRTVEDVINEIENGENTEIVGHDFGETYEMNGYTVPKETGAYVAIVDGTATDCVMDVNRLMDTPLDRQIEEVIFVLESKFGDALAERKKERSEDPYDFNYYEVTPSVKPALDDIAELLGSRRDEKGWARPTDFMVKGQLISVSGTIHGVQVQVYRRGM